MRQRHGPIPPPAVRRAQPQPPGTKRMRELQGGVEPARAGPRKVAGRLRMATRMEDGGDTAGPGIL
eukprot:1042402-Alexandrium_andersonii.AAC.1